MRSIKLLSAAFFVIAVLCFALPVNSQSIYVLDSPTTTGEADNEKKSLSMDFMKENFVYILVKFTGAYGQDQIKFKRFVMGQPNPVMPMDTDPSASWVVYEMYIPQAGEYTFTVFDKNDLELGKAYITIKNK